MMRYKLTIQYDGTDFCGWQTQKNGVSVQQTLSDALAKIAKGKVVVVGSGRTDSGVHAYAQVAHVDMDTSVPGEKIKDAVNPYLPESVAVLESAVAPDGFHARYSAKKKTYVYRAYISPTRKPILDRFCLRLDKSPDFDKIKEGVSELIGEHDFKAFSSTGSSVKDTVRTVYSASVEFGDETIEFRITGNGFLYNMVRIIVGTLLDIGYGKREISDIKKAFETGDRTLCGKTVDGRGLALLCVDYGDY